MIDNPNENEYGPGEKSSEIGIMIPISELIELLTKVTEEHSECYLKKCPYCNSPVVFYKDDWYFCQNHNFVKLTGEDI